MFQKFSVEYKSVELFLDVNDPNEMKNSSENMNGSDKNLDRKGKARISQRWKDKKIKPPLQQQDNVNPSGEIEICFAKSTLKKYLPFMLIKKSRIEVNAQGSMYKVQLCSRSATATYCNSYNRRIFVSFFFRWKLFCAKWVSAQVLSDL